MLRNDSARFARLSKTIRDECQPFQNQTVPVDVISRRRMIDEANPTIFLFLQLSDIIDWSTWIYNSGNEIVTRNVFLFLLFFFFFLGEDRTFYSSNCEICCLSIPLYIYITEIIGREIFCDKRNYCCTYCIYLASNVNSISNASRSDFEKRLACGSLFHLFRKYSRRREGSEWKAIRARSTPRRSGG